MKKFKIINCYELFAAHEKGAGKIPAPCSHIIYFY